MRIAFILDHALMHYRIPFFRLLSEKYGYDIVVYHAGKQLDLDFSTLKQVKVERKKILKIFDYRKGIDLSSFNVVVCMQNMRLLNVWKIAFSINKTYKFIQWGIGVSSKSGLESQSTIVRMARNFLMYFADAVVFYSTFPLKYLNKKNRPKSFVALNTIENTLSEDLSLFPKDAFIFIGSLNKRKGLRELLTAFHKYLKHRPENIKKLFVIGDGEEYEYLAEYIKINGLGDSILLLGRIEDARDKVPFFKRSIASISLNQAGLSVLESFSYGVPFISKEKAISGGEHLNIKDFETGFLVMDENEFVERLIWIDSHIEETLNMGVNAYNYYSDKANMEAMVDSFNTAINYTI